MKQAFALAVFLFSLSLFAQNEPAAQPAAEETKPEQKPEPKPEETVPQQNPNPEPAPAPETQPSVEPGPDAVPSQSDKPAPNQNQQAEPALPEASVDVDLNVVSNFIDRGEDVGAGYTQQRREKYDNFTAPWFFQPSVTFHTPVEGLSFNVFASIALRGRADTEVDQRLESGADGNQTLLTDSVNPFINNSGLTPYNYIRTQIEAAGTYPAVSIPAIQVYNFYKEHNGLYRRDQVDLTIAYERETSIGLLGGGIIASNRGNEKGKSNPFGDSGANYQSTEMYFSYALPFLTNLKFTYYGDIVNSNQRLEADFGHEFELNDSVSLGVSAVTGYAWWETTTGWQDLDLGTEVSVNSFVFGVHWVYRPTLEFFDEDSDLSTRYLMLDGGSSKSDGMVADPRKVGLGDDLIRGLITQRIRATTGNAAYTYTARQKLPRWVNYVTLGYKMSF